MPTRRIVRSAVKLSAAVVFILVSLFFLDRNYRVLPAALHEYMPAHQPGLVITDVTIATCSSLNPFSSCELDPGTWHKIDKELYMGRSWTRSYLYVQHKHEEKLTAQDAAVVDMSVGRLDPKLSKNEPDEVWESRPAGIWIKRSTNKRLTEADKSISAIDVLFGDDASEAREGWAMVGTPLLLNTEPDVLSAHLSVRRGAPIEPAKPKPRIPDNGRFKIMQISDMHLSNGVGVCRQAVPNNYKDGPCEADPRLFDFLNKVLDEEQPGLVVLGGDQINGETAPDAPTAILKYASLLAQRKLPYAGIFGNHDDKKSMSREGQMALMETLPYSLSMAGPADVSGVGNYYVEILARGKSDHSALTLYFFDTHSQTLDRAKSRAYDWVHPDQIAWFHKTAASLKSKHNEYTHKHMDLSFIHIPLTEYTNYTLPRVGAWREGVTAPSYNSGLRDALVEEGVVMVSAGHDHCNDFCALSLQSSHKKDGKNEGGIEQESPALWMCYAGGSGFGGYAGYQGYHRSVRVFEVDTNEARITTWKRLEYGRTEDQVDKQIIVDAGRPIMPLQGEYVTGLPMAPPPDNF